ncbi:hypothetical protein HF086_016609 [Spodoptera exigua]|uniref:Tubby C-terminal domain-containing protein n=1 Tax=Spodoptera exigua TaxID=7107 RepID=A0A922MDD3_SPOEX|nr:hypothetical protein HF086_016609 [Spodoptera exigua]
MVTNSHARSLEQLALRLLASRSLRAAGGAGAGAGGGVAREVSSAPASPRPRPARDHGAAPAPAPHTPQHTPPRRHRYSSASPIRQLLNSPLLNRRRNKKPSESSDDEYSTGGGYSELKRAGGVMSGSSTAGDSRNNSARRQLVMHNKAPMWNENSQVMQFGRIDGNAYTLDFQYPFSALQAFAVALANVTQRLK